MENESIKEVIMALPYSEKVIEYFRNPKNVGEIDNADAIATEGSPALARNALAL